VKPANAAIRHTARPHRGADSDVVRRCLQGDPDAWAELVHRYANSVYAIARRQFGLEPCDADDVFQETFSRTYQHLPRLRSHEAIGPYIRQIARRTCIDHLTKPNATPVAEINTGVDEGSIQRMEQKIVLRQALDRLPPINREVIDRFFLRDECYRTISQALDLPHGTIASRIARGLERVRAELD
jgi:RNA polymerase sigma-70 factor (ECF subfamily)